MDRWLQNNNILRIIAVVLSCILWLSVSAPGSDTTSSQVGVIERQFSYPVKIETASDMVASVVSNPTAVVSVNLSVANVSSVPAQMLDVAIVADARGLTPGRHTIALAAVNMPSISYTVAPLTISVVLEKKTQMQRDVKINVQGTPSAGYLASRPSTDTPVVQVRGAKETVERVTTVVATVSVQGASQDVTKTVPLSALDAQGKPVAGAEVSPASVTVSVPVQAPQVTVGLTPQVIGTPVPGYAVTGVTLSPASVTVFGTPTTLSQLQTLSVPVNVTGIRQTTLLHTKVPLTTGVSRVDPATIAVTVTVEPSVSKYFTGIPIQIENPPANRQVTLSGPTTVDISVAGPKSVIDGLSATAIQVFVDASKLTASSPAVPISVLLPAWVQVNQLSVDKVPVTVK